MPKIVVCYYVEPPHITMCSSAAIDLDVYRETVKALGCTGIGYINPFGIEWLPDDLDMDIRRFTSIKEAMSYYQDYNQVFVEIPEKVPVGVESIQDNKFVHPAGDTVYFFGSDDSGLGLTLKSGMTIVTIPTLLPCMWSVGAMAIILRGRLS